MLNFNLGTYVSCRPGKAWNPDAGRPAAPPAPASAASEGPDMAAGERTTSRSDSNMHRRRPDVGLDAPPVVYGYAVLGLVGSFC